ncbi:MAG: riboflavin biosynthesis protein RibD [Micavibrio sp.]|nr:MAG: riboflavin biosynthesis protein RibD [Micavibrio sp.]
MPPLNDIHHMLSALALARRGLGRTWPNPSVGCVIVNKSGQVVGRGVTGDGGRPHAETIALKQAGTEAKGGCVYVSLEPCAHHGETPPCTDSLIKSGVKRVVLTSEDKDSRVAGKGIKLLRDAGIEVEAGVLAEEAYEINQGFNLRVTENRPLVTIKSATSSDYKIAEKARTRTQITGERSMMRAQLERSQHDVVLVGINTVLTDDPLLTSRLPGHDHDIVRVVLDSNLRIPVDCQLVKTASQHPLWVIHKEGESADLEKAGAKLLQTDPKNAREVLKLLAQEGITRLLIEGGAKVSTAFLEAGFCDRFLHFQAPTEIGNDGVDALMGHSIADLEQDFGLKRQKTSSYGEDFLAIYTCEA